MPEVSERQRKTGGIGMPAVKEKPPARPVFRKLALGTALVCFVLALVAWIVAPADGGDSLFGVWVCVFVGMVMVSIAATGYWPPRRRR
jgi:hypothetical protein